MASTMSTIGEGRAPVIGTLGLFQDVLDHELSCAERYRRFVSLVMVRGTSPDSPLRRILADRIRSSDLLAEQNSRLVILMSETDHTGAAIAIDRYRDFCADIPLWFSSVTFPQDTGSGADLFEVAERRLQLACQEDPGAVVATD